MGRVGNQLPTKMWEMSRRDGVSFGTSCIDASLMHVSSFTILVFPENGCVIIILFAWFTFDRSGISFCFPSPPQKLLFFFAFIWQSVKEIFLPRINYFLGKSPRKKSGAKTGNRARRQFGSCVAPSLCERAPRSPYSPVYECRFLPLSLKAITRLLFIGGEPEKCFQHPIFQPSEFLVGSHFPKWFNP